MGAGEQKAAGGQRAAEGQVAQENERKPRISKAALRYRAPVALCEQRAHTQAVVEKCPLRDDTMTVMSVWRWLRVGNTLSFKSAWNSQIFSVLNFAGLTVYLLKVRVRRILRTHTFWTSKFWF